MKRIFGNNNPIKKAIDSVNIKSKLSEVKSEVKDIGSSISQAISNAAAGGNLDPQAHSYETLIIQFEII